MKSEDTLVLRHLERPGHVGDDRLAKGRPTDQTRPYRSVLYIPGANERALEKAKGVEQMLQDTADAKRREIEEKTY